MAAKAAAEPASRAAGSRALGRTRASRRCMRGRRDARWGARDEARCCIARSRRSSRWSAASAVGHPLGNFSINHLTQVSVSSDRGRRPLHPRPGRDPDVPGARARRRRGARAQAGRDRGGLQAHGRTAAASRSRVAPATIAFPPGQGGLQLTTRSSSTSLARPRRRAARARARRDLPRPRRLEGDRRSGHGAGARRTRRTGCARYPKARPVEPARRARRRRFACAGGALAVPATARRCTPPPTAPATASRAVRGRRRGQRRAPAAAARRVRLGRAARALARPRQGDGRRLPRRHARHRASRRRARRDRDRHAHDRRLRARARDARALAVRPARGPLPVAEPRLGAAGRDRRRGGAARASRITTTITTTTTPRPYDHEPSSRWAPARA